MRAPEYFLAFMSTLYFFSLLDNGKQRCNLFFFYLAPFLQKGNKLHRFSLDDIVNGIIQ